MLISWLHRHLFWALALHVALGFAGRYQPALVTAWFALAGVWAAADVLASRDRDDRAALWAMYLCAFEIVYRMGKSYLLWELGKYLCIAVLLSGLLVRPEQARRGSVFVWYLALLFPGVVVALSYGAADPTYLRKLMLQHLSGPLTLAFAGWYFYRRPMADERLRLMMQAAFWPMISVLTLLFLGKKVSEISFAAASNAAASGGFGANQVSTALGFGVAVLAYARFRGWRLSGSAWLDTVLLLLLLYRCMLTFSRGGLYASVGAVLMAFVLTFLSTAAWRRQFGRLSLRLTLFVLALIGAGWQVNRLTNNALLLRLQGKTFYETKRGVVIQADKQGYLTNRDALMRLELFAFSEHPFWGVGAGMGTLYRERRFERKFASHTEHTRLLGEHGLPGILILLCFYLLIPLGHFARLGGPEQRFWFVLWFVLANASMLHAQMRLSMPGVAFGLAFVAVLARAATDTPPRMPASSRTEPRPHSLPR